MSSNDIQVIINDEQQFRLFVVNKLGSLESRVSNLESDVKGLRAEVKHISDQQIAFAAKMDMLLWGAGIIIGAATLAVTLWSVIKPSHSEKPESSSTVINIPQPDIDSIARKVGEIFGLEPKH